MMNSNQKFQAIMDLDFDQIKVKLMEVGTGEGWSQTKANLVETEYRRFLYLADAYPQEMITPLEDVDTFWHYHILDTMKYAADCEATFGYFLHHFPYFGMRGDDDVAVHQASGERMHTLYEESFGASYAAAAQAMTQAENAAPAFCMSISTKPEQPAFCMATTAEPAQPAFCMATTAKLAQPAFCMSTTAKLAQPAFCMATTAKPAQPAFCMATTGKPAQPAFCMSIKAEPARPAFGMSIKARPTQPAFCMAGPAAQ